MTEKQDVHEKPKRKRPVKTAKSKSTQKTKATEVPAFRLEESDGIGVLIFDMPGSRVNILGSPTMRELDRMLDELASKPLRALIFLSGKEKNFIAGADIEEIRGITDPEDAREKSRLGQMIFQKIADLPYPTIAAIDGTCVGGGLELALACDYRIARDDPNTRIGLPEVNLGILPAWGGSARLPRLIGIERALDMILSGKLLDAHQAYRRGVVDRVLPREYPPEYVRQLALDFALEILAPPAADRIRSRRKPSGLRAGALEKTPVGRRLLFSQARKRVEKRTGGHYPAPLKALQAIEKGVELPLPQALELEAKFLGDLVVSDVCKNLVFLFFLREALRKDSGVGDAEVKPKEIRRVGVLGAGVMGGGIAQLLAYYDIPVRMKDINWEAVAAGYRQARKVFDGALRRRRLSEREVERKMSLISGATDYSGFGLVDLVIEAIVEDLEIKKKVFRELVKEVRKDTVLASNTSSLSITEMGKATRRPGQFVGMHFFNPVHRMPLVEVVRGDKTSDETVATTVAFAKRLGKTPIVVRDRPGFLVNRILAPYLNEAALILQEGGKIDEVDSAMLDFGMPMGPFNLVDEIGIDVAVKVARVLTEAFGDRMQPSPVLQRLYDDGRYGKKKGRGFYVYKKKSKEVDPSVYKLLADLRQPGTPLTPAEMQDRMVLLMLNEAAVCLAEGLVRQPRDVDGGMVFGTGFPPFRGGLLRYADQRGLDAVVERLEAFAQQYGDRFAPAPLLKEMAAKGERFYPDS
jgi:3-hydroxyacyl-CoA dehydrogenase/enoyl-CoA hydratase/3-hydroxybutyryl-CoA epimerase